MPPESVDCCVTSPPYFNLRDYGCGEQIGNERTPDEYVDAMCDVFKGVWRALKKTGTVWLNLGDSYCTPRPGSRDKNRWPKQRGHILAPASKRSYGLKKKDLIGIPWRVAFALQRDGWYLRQDIIWHKPNTMPESVQDRCTKSHEYIFLLSKQSAYYFDYKAIEEPQEQYERDRRLREIRAGHSRPVSSLLRDGEAGMTNQSRHGCARDLSKVYDLAIYGLKRKRSVWTISTRPFKDSHFATFPEDLVIPCIAAGCPGNGVVLDPFCGAGTVGIVAAKMGRAFVGIELNEKYVEISKKRISKECGLLAMEAV